MTSDAEIVERLKARADTFGHELDLLAVEAVTRLSARVEELERGLTQSAERWRDMGEVIKEHGKYDNAGFCEATVRRCFSVLEGNGWDPGHMNPIPSDLKGE